MSNIPGFHFDPLHSKDLLKSFEALRKMLVSIYGPKGRLKILADENGDGGGVLSSSFSEISLLKNDEISNPFIRFILGAAKNHSCFHGDGAKFVCLLICVFIQRFSELSLDRYLLTKIFDYISSYVIELLSACDSLMTEPVDFDNAHKLLAVIRTIIASKPGCNHSRENSEHLAFLVLRGFLNTLPNYNSDRLVTLRMGSVYFNTIEGPDPNDSFLTEGLLVPRHHDVESIRHILSKQENQPFTVLIYNISLDGNIGFSDSNVQLACSLNSNEVFYDELKHFGQKVVENVTKPTLIACQKVVHPMLLQYFIKKNVLVLDRLGTEMTEMIKLLTGSQPLSTLDLPDEYKYFGYVENIKLLEHGGKEFVHLHNREISIHTIVLYNLTEESLSETKLVCKQAVKALHALIKSKKSIIGGGCAEVIMSAELRNWINMNLDNHIKKLKCTKEQMIRFSQIFCSALEEISTYSSHQLKLNMLRDNAYFHLWEEQTLGKNCVCGLIKRDDPLIQNFTYLTSQNVDYWDSSTRQIKKRTYVPCNSQLVLDEYSCRINVWQIAFETTSLLLHTGLYVEKK